MKIIVGISGGIAAYKTASLVRLLIKQGDEVRVVMTEFAKNFITPLTLATLSKNPVVSEFFNTQDGDWNSHVDLGLWADAYLVAPATANTMAKMANGIADNFLLTVYLSAKCPVFFAPSMDLDMYKHKATLQNVDTLINRGNICIEANSGELASGLTGKGRMQEPEAIVEQLNKYFNQQKDFAGKNVLITAGATQETIDPVRFITNHSSGKMGFSIADEFASRGANVIVVRGKVSVKCEDNSNIRIVEALSAEEMFDATRKYFKKADIIVYTAAVSDYTPVNKYDTKIKKDLDTLTIELKKTKDIAKELGELKRNNQFAVGFALETDNEIENAKTKLAKKNFDIIVLNSLQDKGAGFQYDTNKISIIDKKGTINKFDLKNKKEVAKDIVNEILSKLIISNKLKTTTV